MTDDERGGVDLWLAGAREGHAEDANRLVRHYRPILLRFVTAHMGRKARRWTTPEDVVQHVLAEIVKTLGGLPETVDEEMFRRRLFQLSDWRIKDTIRNHREILGESAVLNGLLERPAEERSDGTVTRRDTLVWLGRLVDRLPSKYGDVVRLLAIESVPIEEAARRLGSTPEAVRKRYERARAMLARRLAREDR